MDVTTISRRKEDGRGQRLEVEVLRIDEMCSGPPANNSHSREWACLTTNSLAYRSNIFNQFTAMCFLIHLPQLTFCMAYILVLFSVQIDRPER
jgi:hypothetical protein